tara:strand:+ start:2214 stop:2537 length:324 start_codon:yes stop_codon:yes gene_type:complete
MINKIDPIGQQEIISYSEARESISFKLESGVNDYMAIKAVLVESVARLNEVIDAVNGSSPLFGAQTPEGNVASNGSQIYFDTTNSPTDVSMYFNENVGVNTGWVKVV